MLFSKKNFFVIMKLIKPTVFEVKIVTEKMEKTKKTNPHKGHRERMKNRYIEQGFRSFEPHELVEMLLYFGVAQQDTNPLAHELLNMFGTVKAVLRADREILLSVKGVTPHVATLLNLVGDLHRYCAEEEQPLGVPLRVTKDFVAFLKPRFDGLPVEEVWVVCLDVLSRVVGVHRVSRGTPANAEVNLRNILQYVLSDNASKMIVAHNHPSGIALPSEPDIHMTVALAKALNAMNVQLRDHLIFARDNECVSFNDTDDIECTLHGIMCK